jgi:hypothetical protein
LAFAVQEIVAPANDHFDEAMEIPGLPFDHTVDVTAATTEPGEPEPSCAYDPPDGTVWYAFTPSQDRSIMAFVQNAFSDSALAVYTGDSLDSLEEIGSRCGWQPLTFQVEAGTTYYLQVALLYGYGGSLQLILEEAPPPQAEFWFYPDDPSTLDTIQFYDYSYDPAEMGIESQVWKFGDGASATGCCPTHRYAADGDYTVELTVETYDGRVGSTSRVATVQTHDVGITKLSTPKVAKAGQTRSTVVRVKNSNYPERVEVQLYKSVPWGFEHIGTLTQRVPVRSGGRTTNFNFSYTFTHEDAAIGKVTFRAVAYLIDARDAFFSDNEAITAPTKVNP